MKIDAALGATGPMALTGPCKLDHENDIDIIMERVESKFDIAMAKQMRIPYVQGFYFEQPPTMHKRALSPRELMNGQ